MVDRAAIQPRVGIRTQERKAKLCADTACLVTASPFVTQTISMMKMACSFSMTGPAREYAIQVMDELQKDAAVEWINYTMELMREGRVVWRIPFNRASLQP